MEPAMFARPMEFGGCLPKEKLDGETHVPDIRAHKAILGAVLS